MREPEGCGHNPAKIKKGAITMKKLSDYLQERRRINDYNEIMEAANGHLFDRDTSGSEYWMSLQ